MSYPPPPGPQDPPPQNPPPGQNPIGQNPGWQQPTYPQGGNWAAPPYGTPPPKNRAGLIIALIVLLVVAVIGIIGFAAYRLTSGGSDNGGTAPAGPLTSTQATTAPSKAPTTAPPSKPMPSQPVPSKTVPSKPVASRPPAGTKQAAFALAERFAAALNADDTDAAVALTCPATKQIIPALISNWIKPPTKLTVTNAVIGEDPFLVTISGTTHGQQMGGLVVVQGSCVQVFNLNRS